MIQIEICTTFQLLKVVLARKNVPTEKEWVAREFWLGGGPKMGPIITGSVTAMDVNSGKVVGKYDMDYPNLGGLLATKEV